MGIFSKMTWQPWFKTNNSIIQLIIQEEGRKNRDGTRNSVPVIFWEIPAAECRDADFYNIWSPSLGMVTCQQDARRTGLPAVPSVLACRVWLPVKQHLQTLNELWQKKWSLGESSCLNLHLTLRERIPKRLWFFEDHSWMLFIILILNLGNITFGFCMGMNIYTVLSVQ